RLRSPGVAMTEQNASFGVDREPTGAPHEARPPHAPPARPVLARKARAPDLLGRGRGVVRATPPRPRGLSTLTPLHAPQERRHLRAQSPTLGLMGVEARPQAGEAGLVLLCPLDECWAPHDDGSASGSSWRAG